MAKVKSDWVKLAQATIDHLNRIPRDFASIPFDAQELALSLEQADKEVSWQKATSEEKQGRSSKTQPQDSQIGHGSQLSPSE
jgi:hypothetical protein